MNISRLQFALRAFSIHLTASIIIAALSAWLVFGVWYPTPFDQISYGKELFKLIIFIDVICGPLLTLVIFNPLKSKKEIFIDLTIICLIQSFALGYGLYKSYLGRPVYVVFEADQFRIVHFNEINKEELTKAPIELRRLGFWGPKVIAARLIDGSDPDFLNSVNLAIAGKHPAYRPERWVKYESQREKVTKSIRDIYELLIINPDADQKIISRLKVRGKEVGFIPLATKIEEDWVVIVNKKTLKLEFYLPFSGW